MDVKNYFKQAQKERWAIGQFNTSNLETLRAIVKAAQKLKSPVIVGTSEGESKFIGLKQAVALINAFREETGLPVFLNLDHGRSFEYIKEAISAGYDMVHFDGSDLPLRENIKITKKIVDICRKKNISVEGEIGIISGSSRLLSEAPKIGKEMLTNPGEALQFIKETGVDRLAMNIGSFHGIGKVGRKNINLKRLKEIKERVGDKVFLVLHGGSGIPEKQIREAIKSGIVKININTELRLAFSGELRKVLAENPEETTPYKYFPEVIEAVEKIVEEKIKLFTQAKRSVEMKR